LKDGDGKDQRFIFSKGAQRPIYIPERTRREAKTSAPKILTEGFFKGLALLHAGGLPIALGGCWGISQPIPKGDQEKGNNRVLSKELGVFKWNGTTVYFAFDIDRPGNKNVRQSEIRAWMLLKLTGAVVKVLRWPEGKGVDDYLGKTAGTDQTKKSESLEQLCSDAITFEETLIAGPGRDAELVRAELYKCKMGPADRSAFAKLAAPKLKVAVATLLPKEVKGGNEEEKDKKVKVPPTATPSDEEVTTVAVLDEICETIGRFVWMKTSQRKAVALWIVLTYLHDAVDILPVLLITSPESECGKSTLLKLVLYLSNRSIPTSNVSAASIYRVIKDDCPTLILDEADTYMKEDEALRSVIDSGHEREFAYVLRVINDQMDVGQLSTWCPKAIAMIGLPKKTIISRSIHARMDRKGDEIKKEKLRRKHFKELEPLRRKIARVANDIRERVRVFQESDLLGNRADDNWSPLFAIADTAGEQWLKDAVQAATRMSRKDAQDIKSFGRYLLESLGRFIQAKREAKGLSPTEKVFLPTEDLLSPSIGLNADKEAPWFAKSNDGLSANGLSNWLKVYDIKSVQSREGQDRGKRGYWSDKLEEKIENYVQ
jgi:putative DNA primase/helicase